jgi:hypothetical protein
MTHWEPIQTAPMDGTILMLKRVHQGKVVTQACGYYGKLSAEAPQRQWQRGNAITPDGPPFENCDEPRWCKEGGLYNFPAPTHWAALD